MKVLTANRLIDGEVVFWRAGQWAERFAEADVFTAETAQAGEAAVTAAKGQPTVVVDPYLIDIADGPAGPAPVSYRERIRALGPTNEPDHGKQAEGGAAIAALQAATGAARSTGRVDLIRRK
jgi:sulfite reductase (NADPH) hemoprotein beta-component